MTTVLGDPDLRDLGLADADIPWWAVSVLDLTPRTDEYRMRRIMQNGLGARVRRSPQLLDLWSRVVDQARTLAQEVQRDEFVASELERARRGALSSPRAFYEFCQILDDTGRVPVLKDFQVRGIRAMRTQDHCLELWPFAHGKSWHSSVTVPLMDWAEFPDFTEGRIYHSYKFAKTWTRTLMYIVEHNPHLHALFPWVDRPDVGDPCNGIWSLDGFCIKGKSSPQGYSFEALTVNQGTTGRRYGRTGCDDWVVSDNASSETLQDAMWDYFFTGPMTFQKPVPFSSSYDTRISTLFVVGTLFDRRDFGSRLKSEWQSQGHPVHRVDVFVDENSHEVVWPEERPYDWVMKMRASMPEDSFNARVRNLIHQQGNAHFPETAVASAMRPDLVFGEPPVGAELWIGFDPASGKRGKSAKYPAFALLAFAPDDVIHIVKWARWPVAMPRQVSGLIEHARLYQCPVAVEDASQQIAYRHWINLQDSTVRVVCHSTTAQTKRDWRQGVESLIPYFEAGKVAIHTGNAPPADVTDLRREFVEYPQSRTTDLLMAVWIAKYQQWQNTQRGVTFTSEAPPSYVRSRGYNTMVLDLRALREGRTQALGGGGYCPHCEKMRCICPPGQRILVS